VVLTARARGLGARDQAFLAAALAVTCSFVVEVSLYTPALPWFRRVFERSMFYAAPLLVVALLLWIERGMPRPRFTALAAAAVLAGLPATLPYGSLLTENVTSDTLALVPWLKLRETAFSPQAIRAVILLASLGAAVVFLRLPRRRGYVLPAAVLVYFALVLTAVENRFRLVSFGASVAVAELGAPDWIDRAVGPSATASVVRSGDTLDGTTWGTEFFNRSVRNVYDLGEPLPGGLPEASVHLDGSGVVRDHLGRPVYGPYALADRSLDVAGRVVARSPSDELTLYAVAGPVHVTARTDGRYWNDTWYRPSATYTRSSCRGGELSVGVLADADVFPNGQRVEALVAGRVAAGVDLPPGRERVLTVTVPARGGRCTVELRTVRQAHTRGARGQELVGARYTFFTWR
jgi:hypothetical protein